MIVCHANDNDNGSANDTDDIVLQMVYNMSTVEADLFVGGGLTGRMLEHIIYVYIYIYIYYTILYYTVLYYTILCYTAPRALAKRSANRAPSAAACPIRTRY